MDYKKVRGGQTIGEGDGLRKFKTLYDAMSCANNPDKPDYGKGEIILLANGGDYLSKVEVSKNFYSNKDDMVEYIGRNGETETVEYCLTGNYGMLSVKLCAQCKAGEKIVHADLYVQGRSEEGVPYRGYICNDHYHIMDYDFSRTTPVNTKR